MLDPTLGERVPAVLVSDWCHNAARLELLLQDRAHPKDLGRAVTDADTGQALDAQMKMRGARDTLLAAMPTPPSERPAPAHHRRRLCYNSLLCCGVRVDPKLGRSRVHAHCMPVASPVVPATQGGKRVENSKRAQRTSGNR